MRKREQDILAIPLTPAEAQLLVTALQENDRLHRIHFWTHDGCGWSRREASAVLGTAGTAAALGHPVVPVLVQELHMYGDVVMNGLQQYAPGDAITRDFGQLLNRMHALAGMAQVRRWRVSRDEPAGMCWAGQPPGPPGQEQAAALPAGRRRWGGR